MRYAAPAGAPYTARNVVVPTPGGFNLAGTLTLPAWASTSRPAPACRMPFAFSTARLFTMFSRPDATLLATPTTAVRDLNPKIQTFDASCFDGSYITGDVTTEYLDRLEYMRKHPEVVESGGLQMNLGYSANQ